MKNNKITLDDLKRKATQINQALTEDIKRRKVDIYAGAAAAAVAAIYLSYLIGKRRGRR